MISQIHVLSAAHCFEEPNNLSRYSVGIELHELQNSTHLFHININMVRPWHISNHPNYKMLCGEAEIPDFDFSILHFQQDFKKNFPLNDWLIPACLPDASIGGDFLAGKNLTISGWGEPFLYYLQKATLPGASDDDCKTYIDTHGCPIPINSTNMLCAGNLANRKVADANGDSGGSIQC